MDDAVQTSERERHVRSGQHWSGWWVAASWVVWPAVLTTLGLAALWVWLQVSPSVNTFEIRRSDVAALETMSRLETISWFATLAVLVGPPLTFTAAWFRGRGGTDRDRPT